MELPKKKYQIIYADPPWRFGDRFKGRYQQNPLERHYPTMTTNEIKSIPVEKIIDDDAILFLWTTDAHLPDALEVIKSWGFEYKTIGFIWNKKLTDGRQVYYMGRWTVKSSELCLLATRGHIHSEIKNHKVKQLVNAKRKEHSYKPEEVRKRIEKLMGELPRIELFARNRIEGWDTYGNELSKTIQKRLS